MSDEFARLREELEALSERATPAPWTTCWGAGGWVDVEMLAQDYRKADLPFVLALANNLPTILRALAIAEVGEEVERALRLARRAMHNDWHNKPRIGMETECEAVDAALAKLKQAREG